MRTALVTGSTGGLGEHIVRFLDSREIATVVHCYREEGKARLLMSELKNVRSIIKCDVSDYRETESIANDLLQRDIIIDIIINNAAITIDKLLMKYNEDEWDRVINTNLTGSFNVIKHFLPHMIKKGRGDIINISSYSGIRGSRGQAAYSASKAGIIGLTLSLSRELSVYNIKANVVVPGYLPLGMGLRAKDAMKRAKDMSARGALSTADDVNQMIYFILSSSTITGQVFTIESRVGYNY